MLDKLKIENFWQSRTKIDNPVIATHFKEDDSVIYDINLIKKNSDIKNCKVLELGAGTGRMTNILVSEVQSIVAVDKFEQFLDKIKDTINLKKLTSDLLNYFPDEKYDLILSFGVFSYFSDEEIFSICQRMKIALKDNNSKFIIKHQCGVNEDVIIDQFSEKLGQHYNCIYRQVDREIEFYKGIFNSVEVVDIYPNNLNPWPNTHFYAFICHN